MKKLKDFSKCTQQELLDCSVETLIFPELSQLLKAINFEIDLLVFNSTREKRPFSSDEESVLNLLTEKRKEVEKQINNI